MNANEPRTVDSVPVAYTPPGGWSTWPDPILAGCTEPRPAGADDLDGYWRTIEVIVDGEIQTDHPTVGLVQRIEQRGDRIVVTAAGIIHDMRCDGTLERGVHDVAEFDKTTCIDVVATYEDEVHVLRPEGMPIEVRRRRDGEHLVWDYLGFTARLTYLGPSAADPADIGDVTDVSTLQPIEGTH